MKQINNKEILKHMGEIGTFFNISFSSDYEKIKLYRKIMKIERKAHLFAENCCNFLDLSDEEHEKKINLFLSQLDELLNFKKQNIPVFINTDPRGYALKIESDYVRDKQINRDWGGYGLICPSF